MENNADKLNVETLNRYLDGELSAEERTNVETRLTTDDDAKALLDNLLIARDTIESLAVKNSVAQAFVRYKGQSKVQETAKLVSMKRTGTMKKLLLAAACLVLLFISYISYVFVSTSNDTVFNEYYLAYNLPVSRDVSVDTNTMDSVFKANDFNGFVTLFLTEERPTQKKLFLAALSYLNLNQTSEAIELLLKLRENNKTLPDPLFEQESDYYLALAYIKAGKTDEARALLSEVSQNPAHMFYKKAQSVDAFSLRILSIKNK